MYRGGEFEDSSEVMANSETTIQTNTLTSYMPLRIVTINKVLSLSEVTVTKDPGTTGDPLVLCRSTVDPKLEFCPRPFGFLLQSGPARLLEIKAI